MFCDENSSVLCIHFWTSSKLQFVTLLAQDVCRFLSDFSPSHCMVRKWVECQYELLPIVDVGDETGVEESSEARREELPNQGSIHHFSTSPTPTFSSVVRIFPSPPSHFQMFEIVFVLFFSLERQTLNSPFPRLHVNFSYLKGLVQRVCLLIDWDVLFNLECVVYCVFSSSLQVHRHLLTYLCFFSLIRMVHVFV